MANGMGARPAATVLSTGDETHALEDQLAHRPGRHAFYVAVPLQVNPGEDFRASVGGQFFRLRCPPEFRRGQCLEVTVDVKDGDGATSPPAYNGGDETKEPPAIVPLAQLPAIPERDQRLLPGIPAPRFGESSRWCQRAICLVVLVVLGAYGVVYLNRSRASGVEAGDTVAIAVPSPSEGPSPAPPLANFTNTPPAQSLSKVSNIGQLNCACNCNQLNARFMYPTRIQPLR